jgi:glutathione-specific gamma-glutamylcyclotransferase
MAIRPIPDSEFPHGDLWVFGYGSLMWQPGFDFIAEFPARLIGEHRSLCIYSHVHRGTPEKPGLVLGLDRGGICQGTVFQVAEDRRGKTLAYLRDREQKNGVYREVLRSVWIEGDARQRVQALTYVADRSHPQYAGELTLEQQLHYVANSHGASGANRDYVISTVKALEARGCRDAQLHNLVALLQGDAPLRRA